MTNDLSTKLGLMCAVALLAACSPGKREPAKTVAKGAPPAPLLIPVPRDFKVGTNAFRVDAATVVTYSGGAGAAEAAQYFADLARQNPEITVRSPREDDSESKSISFLIAP